MFHQIYRENYKDLCIKLVYYKNIITYLISQMLLIYHINLHKLEIFLTIKKGAYAMQTSYANYANFNQVHRILI